MTLLSAGRRAFLVGGSVEASPVGAVELATGMPIAAVELES